MSQDKTAELAEQVKQAHDQGTPLAIHGGGSKHFLGQPLTGETLDVTGHQGIVNYQPVELVMTVRAGTPLAEVKAALAEKGQCLAFEPPAFGPKATIGGTIATGVSGPARPYTGAARDYMLGMRMINGQGEALRFGGEVMKNVAGYDVSRLVTASHGILGVITEVSLKVLPQPKAVTTHQFECTVEQAVQQFNQWAGQPLPITATAWADGQAYVRLAGAASAVRAASSQMPGAVIEDSPWDSFAELSHASVQGKTPLWRLSVPQTAALDLQCPLIEWGGAQRWYAGDMEAGALREKVAAVGGHATLYRGEQASVFHPLEPAMHQLQQRIKASFDPKGLFNQGRFYPEF